MDIIENLKEEIKRLQLISIRLEEENKKLSTTIELQLTIQNIINEELIKKIKNYENTYQETDKG